MSSQHTIVGSEAFARSAKQLAPAHGALRTFGPVRRRGMPKWFAPAFIGSGLLFLMALGKTVSAGSI